ncbi:MAG: hypothetical protein ABJF88_07680 [Rhodothermales bacterium]
MTATLRPIALTAFALALAWSALPAAAQVVVRSPLSDDRTVPPGEVYEGTIVVANTTDEVQQAKVYQTDYSFHADGSNRYDAPGSSPRSNAGWIEFGPRAVTLAPGETIQVQYRVTVPAEADGQAPAGTYWSMLMVEGIPRNSAESTLGDDTTPQYGVRQVTRYGVQIATHLLGSERPTIGFQQVRLQTSESGGRVLEVDLENQGDLFTRSTLWVELYAQDGTAQGRRDGTSTRIYPGTSVRQQIDLSDLTPGQYEALIVVDSGEENVVGAQYTLEL